VRRYLPVLIAVPAIAFMVLHPNAPRPPDRLAPEASAHAGQQRGGLRGDRPPPSQGSVVYVAGAVRRPGLYRVENGARADDAVRLAGGMIPQADASGVNLAERVADGDEIYVPPAGESPRARRVRSRRSGRARGHRRGADAAGALSGHVDLNAAGAGELGAVPGIGPAIAERIVAMRAQEGAFASLDELLDVAGMTPRRLEQARPYVYISD
jgi:competence protein ComEA